MTGIIEGLLSPDIEQTAGQNDVIRQEYSCQLKNRNENLDTEETCKESESSSEETFSNFHATHENVKKNFVIFSQEPLRTT